MKRSITFFILVMLFCFVSCDTTSNYTIKLSVDRLPTLTIVNRTGYPVIITAPVASNLNNGGETRFQPVETNTSINVIYRIGQVLFTEQATMNNADATVTLTKRPPTITVVNQTGYKVSLSVPERTDMDDGASKDFLAPGVNQIIGVTYTIGRMTISEQVNMRDRDVTVTLTRKPPTLTIVNNVGATINTLFIRSPGSPTWTGGNIVIRNGIVDLAAAGSAAQATDISGSIVNRDSMRIWMGNISLSGDRFDIRIDDVQGNTYVKNNVQIINDFALTFNASDRR